MTHIIGSDNYGHRLAHRRDFLKTAALAGGGLALGGAGLHFAKKLIHPPVAFAEIPGNPPDLTYIHDWGKFWGAGGPRGDTTFIDTTAIQNLAWYYNILSVREPLDSEHQRAGDNISWYWWESILPFCGDPASCPGGTNVWGRDFTSCLPPTIYLNSPHPPAAGSATRLRNPTPSEVTAPWNRLVALGMNVPFDATVFQQHLTFPDVYLNDPVNQPLLYGATQPLVYDMCVGGLYHPDYMFSSLVAYIRGGWRTWLCDSMKYFRDAFKLEAGILVVAAGVCALIPLCLATGAPAALLEAAAYLSGLVLLLELAISRYCP